VQFAAVFAQILFCAL